MLLVLDLLGVAVFAASGALAAVHARLDVFGVVVLAAVTALGGGVVRDVLVGVTPPSTLRQWPYLVVPAVVALLVFRWHPAVARLRRGVQLADAFGLALFVTTGTAVALETGAPAITAALVGVITGVGGGVLRDMLLNEIPTVLRREIYALAAAAGAAVVVAGDALALPQVPVALVAAVLVAGLRVLALWRRWNAPLPQA
ncbi:trimeric intracellular cation channel family protein [Pseudonocardia broussonetiae]|uniref:Trimeric intracellular cation channel family protein n=1 Tax=Pseudonocardia broussonetiae TaxID=2736640 RepID=A0A6M6JS73_9PSEU|nr:TRIC cation channel family protein [Pseudonocardia broussonetiae]QJY50093.1 trimeric intracellular cation channel family protein [Pseudonocardia broussonetiae]